jgi:hypothetical protein
MVWGETGLFSPHHVSLSNIRAAIALPGIDIIFSVLAGLWIEVPVRASKLSKLKRDPVSCGV